jgi:hypothetical protein
MLLNTSASPMLQMITTKSIPPQLRNGSENGNPSHNIEARSSR